jgi:hypothetical protein
MFTTKRYENIPVNFAIRLSLPLSASQQMLYGELLKIPVVLIGGFSAVSENEDLICIAAQARNHACFHISLWNVTLGGFYTNCQQIVVLVCWRAKKGRCACRHTCMRARL